MKECLLLVFANKQDLPGAMSPTEITEKLGLLRMKDRSWYCHPSNALAGDGLFEGEYSLIRLSILEFILIASLRRSLMAKSESKD